MKNSSISCLPGGLMHVISECVWGKDNFLFTFFAARMNTVKETYAFQVMKEDVNEGRQDLG